MVSKTTTPRLNSELVKDIDLGAIQSFEDAIKALAAEGVVAVDSTEYGDGFELCKDKDRLVDTPFVIMRTQCNPEGDYGVFTTLYVVTGDGRKLVINDGSKGLSAQIDKLGDKAIGLVCRHGLVKSEFFVSEDTEEVSNTRKDPSYKPAVTYYLSGM